MSNINSNSNIRVNELRFGDYVFSSSGELKLGCKSIQLTDCERKILQIFASKPGETIVRSNLIERKCIAEEHKVDIQINRLRRKIEENPTKPKWLQTVSGVGYRFSINA